MKSQCFKVPFYKITEGHIGMSPIQQFKMEEQGPIIVYRSGNPLLAKKPMEIFSEYNAFALKGNYYQISQSEQNSAYYATKTNSSRVSEMVKKYGFALAIDLKDCNPSTVATQEDIEEYANSLDNNPFYQLYNQMQQIDSRGSVTTQKRIGGIK